MNETKKTPAFAGVFKDFDVKSKLFDANLDT